MKNWGTQIFILIMLVTTISLVNATEASPNIQLNLDDSSIQITEEAELSVAISSQEIEMTKLKINWGDGENKELSIPSGNYLFLTTENHEYNDDGNFEISVEVYCGSERCSTQTTSIKINKPTDKDPNVELISPKKNADFEEDGVSFKFEATDDKELDNCVFELRMKNPKKKLEYSKEY